AEAELRERLGAIGGAQVERKRFSIAVHYRNVRREDVETVARITEQVRSRHPGLRQRGGKMIHELQPRIEWDKGRAVLWLLETLGLDGPDVLPFYVGDDLTDEDAFRALASHGIGILVEPPARPTHARFALRDTKEVEEFLRHLPDLCGAHEP
ncbi:MAG: trehalose-phosphatase, partial [Acidobacteriota bacterium]